MRAWEDQGREWPVSGPVATDLYVLHHSTFGMASTVEISTVHESIYNKDLLSSLDNSTMEETLWVVTLF